MRVKTLTPRRIVIVKFGPRYKVVTSDSDQRCGFAESSSLAEALESASSKMNETQGKRD